jgi:hypothetical protein
MAEGMPAACPACSAPYGDGYEQDYSAGTYTAHCYEPTTLGQQAEKNAKEAGSRYQEMCQRFEESKKKPIPWYRDGSVTERLEKPLDLDKVTDTRKYIETGEK